MRPCCRKHGQLRWGCSDSDEENAGVCRTGCGRLWCSRILLGDLQNLSTSHCLLHIEQCLTSTEPAPWRPHCASIITRVSTLKGQLHSSEPSRDVRCWCFAKGRAGGRAQVEAEQVARAAAKEGLGRRVRDAEARAESLAETVEELRAGLERQRAAADYRFLA